MTEIARGLRDVILTETRLSMIDGLAGKLIIAGFPLEELAPKATAEETIYLLWNDRLPNKKELETFRNNLIANRELPATTTTVLRAAAQRNLPIMDALRMGVDTLSLVDPEFDDTSHEANMRRAVRLLARFPSIVAAYWRLIHGQEPIAPNPRLGHAANFLYMLDGEEPHAAAVRGLETYLNTVIDHGMNNSTFTARVIASTRSDMVSAVVGAVGSLKGPLHGGAPGPAMDMVFEIRDNAAKSGKSIEAEAAAWTKAKLAAKERLMGFGHRVYRVRDPRADVLGAAAELLFARTGDMQFYADARAVEEVILRELEAYKPGNSIKTNVEFYTALVLHGIGLDSKIFSSVFAISRVGGWIAHILEQYAEDELIRPSTAYSGEYDRKWVPLEQRA
ncbi:MAG TPA: citrate/2-methylcitrate synthase [Ktedonosporobacter sp.]|jgi:citrate synthase|nr:citrate/2-methylcitrate synthase [Ktedonosporobacter sp.]